MDIHGFFLVVIFFVLVEKGETFASSLGGRIALLMFTPLICILHPIFHLVLTMLVRGGQKTVKPDLPDQSGRPVRPSVRP
jgi:hypothetical protein